MGEQFPLPSQGEPSQPDASIPDVRERAEAENVAGPSFVPDESVPTFDKDFKVKEEYFNDEGYMHKWAKKHFVGVPTCWTRSLPMGGLIIRNNYSFSPRQILSEGLTHMGVSFQEYSKGFSEMLGGLQSLSKVCP